METRDKDAEIMKLLYAIRKKGIDIEEIYNEDVKTPEEISFMDVDNNNNQNNNNLNINANNKAIIKKDPVEENESEVSRREDGSGVRNVKISKFHLFTMILIFY